MTPTLPNQTERLRFRRLGMEDVDDLMALHQDPAIAHFMGSFDRPGLEEYLAKVSREWRERKHGRVAILERGSGRFVGRTGLKHWPQFGETEVGWMLHPAERGKGYATEAGRASIAWGFEVFELPYITAMIQPENDPSVRVAERLGMKPVRSDELIGEEVVVYAISREDWERS